jgi:superfamily II DNA helicase RecQ
MSRSNIQIPLETIRSSTYAIFNLHPCKFQVQACDLQLRGNDLFLVAPTGCGKSLTFLMPFMWQKEGVAILVSPLQLLGSQHASHPALHALGVKAINLTSETASDKAFKVSGSPCLQSDIFDKIWRTQDIARGVYQLIVASPEYIEQDSRFRTELWNSPEFRNRVERIIFDEAHCILDWGDFRPSYKRLCFLHPLIPHATFFALSATMTPDMTREIQSLLSLDSQATETIRLSNGRTNLGLVVKQMAHTQQSLHDLAFLVPLGLTSGSENPPKFMLFMKSKKKCEKAGNFLRLRLPTELRDKVIWVHSEMSREFNEAALANLKEGQIFGIVCTDVAGMVCCFIL